MAQRTVTEARSIVLDSSLLSGNVSFENERVDRAIQAALRFAIRVTESNWVGTSVAISSRIEDFSSLIDSRFRADRFGGAWIADRPVHEVSMRQMFRLHYFGAKETGQPRKIAFFEDNEAHFFPEPDTTYSFKLWWREPLNDWTPGVANPGVTLNVPEDWVDQALWWGAASMLVHGDPQTPNVEKTRAWKIFLQVLNQFRNTDDPIIGPVEPDAGQLT